MPEKPVDVALAYHLRTRHAPHAYARALPYMDWDTQPDPFRRYQGCPVVLLDRAPTERDVAYDAVIDGRLPEAEGVTWDSVSRLFFDSLALSAWKEAGEARWSLRVNPSSGNLHPTEAWLVCGPVPDLGEEPAVYHYNALLHGLERRAVLPAPTWARIAADLPAGALLVGLTSIPVRESWKYGERAFRYCQHDLGHAVAAIGLAAAAIGWRVRLLDNVPDVGIAALLGVSGQTGPEAELPECLLAVYPDAPFVLAQQRYFRLPPIEVPFAGVPARLASDHHDWPILAEVAEATARGAPTDAWVEHPARLPSGSARAARFSALARGRRSAVDMDGKTSISRAAFLRTMRNVLPGAPPFETLPWSPSIDLFVFVHRVDDLEPGLYALARGPRERLAAVPGVWTAVEPDLPLFLVRAGDLRATAASVSCGQAIASDGAFALGMVCDLEASTRRWGAAFYRRAHWEAGAIGQVLYLEAESDGVRGTGIGCFFDDEMRRVLGVDVASGLRTMYHFTVGGPVEDGRLRTLGPYAHLG